MADPTLSELMERDPLGLAKDTALLTIIIREYRDMRSKFNLGDMKAGNIKSTIPKALKGASTGELADLLSGSLKIDI